MFFLLTFSPVALMCQVLSPCLHSQAFTNCSLTTFFFLFQQGISGMFSLIACDFQRWWRAGAFVKSLMRYSRRQFSQIFYNPLKSETSCLWHVRPTRVIFCCPLFARTEWIEKITIHVLNRLLALLLYLTLFSLVYNVLFCFALSSRRFCHHTFFFAPYLCEDSGIILLMMT